MKLFFIAIAGFFIFCVGLNESAQALEESVKDVNPRSQRMAFYIAQALRWDDETKQPDLSGLSSQVAVNIMSESDTAWRRVSRLMGWSDHTKALRYGREKQEGGNLLHFIARNGGIRPNTVRTVILGWWAENIPVRALSKILKHKDNKGLTPKELAEKLQNEVAFEALSSAESILNRRNTKVLALSETGTVGLMFAGIAGGLTGVLSPQETVLAAGAGGLLSIFCLNSFKSREIPKTIVSPLSAFPE